ncbi:peptide deformylase 1B, chloroplastic/mitochondrial-like isoform X2 [Glycine soja]|uniref:peptide deformylase 1B, chloroplastic/mitochondrial-like isoform X2 n=1 Tax=Glycine soja TaxID=3848 RepID=UPI00103FAB02|nr:peptide deformylase 1B, chloroplastic/mitochondrial-like isoform X2 [Glycine soja]
MASLRCLHPTHPHLHRGSALLAISNRCFNHSSLLNRTLSVNPPRTAPPRAMAKPSFSTAQDLVASPGDFEFAQPLKIVEYPDPRLRARNKRIVAFDDSLKKLVHEMFDVMYKTDGIGLSAPQLGINVQLMVFNPVGERGEGEEIVLVNPRVSQYSKKLTLFNEGCLSFPGINADVKGILFFERMTEEVLDGICGQLQALETKYEGMTGLPSPEKIENRRRRKVAVGFGKR